MADISKIKIQNVIYNVKDETARQNIQDLDNTLTARINNLQNTLLTELVVIGDSYTAFNVSTWAEDLAQQLNLTLHKHAASSMGYVHQVGGQTFIDLLDWDDTSFYDNVKYVICYGGINDYDITRAQIETAVQAFVAKAKTNFPHAQIILVGPQCDAGQFASRKVTKERVAIERGAMSSGVAYVDASDWLINTTYNYTDTYDTDHLHPSALGYKIITSKMLGVINNNPYSDIDLKISFKDDTWSGTIRTSRSKDKTHFSAKITGSWVQGAYNIPLKIEGSYAGNNENLGAFIDNSAFFPVYKIDGNNNVSEFVGCGRISVASATGEYQIAIVPLVANFTGTCAISGDIYLGNWTNELSAD